VRTSSNNITLIYASRNQPNEKNALLINLEGLQELFLEKVLQGLVIGIADGVALLVRVP
jgi:hypothetical protein